MKQTHVTALLLIVSSVYATVPLVTHHEFIRGGWDLSNHISCTFQVSESLKEGILYPRWLSIPNGGYGSPTMIFYSPLFYWLTGVVNLFIPSLVDSLKVTTFIGFLLSGISMYMLLRNFCRNTGSLAGGIAYQLMPYHVFDFYCRQTLTETFAFFWLPLILNFIYKAYTKGGNYNWIGFAFSYAGLVFTHLVSAYVFTFVIVSTAFYLSVREKNFKALLSFAVAFLIGLSISAVYFIPMFFEREYVHIEWLTEGWGGYSSNFLFMTENSNNPVHVQLKKIVILQVLVVSISLILFHYRRRIYKDIHNLHHLIFFSAIFTFSIFISTPYSKPIWDIIPGLPTIHFPWRWLMISTFSSSILIGLTLNTFSFTDIRKDRFTNVSVAAIHALMISNLYLASTYITVAEPMQRNDFEQTFRNGGNLIEYRPIWLSDKKKDFSKEKRSYVTFKEGAGKIDIVSWKSHSRLFIVNIAQPSTVRVSTFYYPGWTASATGKEIPIYIEKDSGAMLINLSPGENTVLLEFKDTPLRRGAKWVSVLSLAAALLCLIAARVKIPS